MIALRRAGRSFCRSDAWLGSLAGPGVTLLDEVEDLGSIYDRVRLTVAPLRIGAGVKSEVFESFAAGLPCMMTPIAAEGITLSAGLRSLVVDDAEAFAERVLHLHKDVPANSKAVAEGLTLIRTHHSMRAVVEALRGAILGEADRALRAA